MDVEKTIQFILDTEARTDARLERLSADFQGLTVAQAQLAENMAKLTDLVHQIAQENWQAHERYDGAHTEYLKFQREVGGRFDALIKMMDEWIRQQGHRNGGQLQ
jgi:outer membrane murein-binding lipoprotein Lpp